MNTSHRKLVFLCILVCIALIMGIYTLWYYTMSNGKLKINNFVDEKYISLRDAEILAGYKNIKEKTY